MLACGWLSSVLEFDQSAAHTQACENRVILTGGKEISEHLRYGVRTVQRWERNGLPVKRVNNSPRSPVAADSEQLDAWILHRIELPPGAPRQRTDSLQRTRELRRESQEIRKELRATLQVLTKTLAEYRAKLRK